eukprot:CAMPEP_0172725746 /NCGR_PEP_ID=MMETSP1074-20121228/89141_1 /TAXON_ID=2916 /ORGANISM="Ceratium fusus, Strain PA161109" /LENGTH=108 /DNA_ID=CAMNT_0013552597 /DNA_START=196 /DNA_END=522 /DNA_ORIENTATION=-
MSSISWADCHVTGIAAGAAFCFGKTDVHQAATWWHLVQICDALSLHEIVVHQPCLPFQVWCHVGVQRLVAMEEDATFIVKHLESCKCDAWKLIGEPFCHVVIPTLVVV